MWYYLRVSFSNRSQSFRCNSNQVISSKFNKQNTMFCLFALQFNGVSGVCLQSWLPVREGGGGGGRGEGAGGIPNNGKYECTGRTLGFSGVNFCPGIRFLATFVTFHKRVNKKWPTY